MTPYAVVILPVADDTLTEIQGKLVDWAMTEASAAAYTKRARDWCETTLDTAYDRGDRRDDIQPGLRTQKAGNTNIIAAWVVNNQMKAVVVTGFYHGRSPNTPMPPGDEDD